MLNNILIKEINITGLEKHFVITAFVNVGTSHTSLISGILKKAKKKINKSEFCVRCRKGNTGYTIYTLVSRGE